MSRETARKLRERLDRAGAAARRRVAGARAQIRPRMEAARARLKRPKLRRPSRRTLYWAGGAAGVLVVAVAVFILIFEWNWLRGPLSAYASARLNREVAIEGDLHVDILSWTPTATVKDLRIADPEWAGGGRMAEVEQVTASIEVLPLLRGRMVLPLLRIDDADVRLLRQADGRATWDFSRPGAPKGEPFSMPPIRRFIIEDGRLSFRDEERGLRFTGEVNARERLGEGEAGFLLAGDGSLNGEAFRLRVTGGPLLNIDPDRPYPFDADVRAGPTRVTARGAIDRPFDLGQFGMQLTAQGPDLAELYGLTGLAFPNTPPYRLSGRLTRDERLYTVADLRGEVGDSDLSGRLSVDTEGERPFLKAALRSRRLDMDDLAAIFGAPPSTAAGETASPTQRAQAAQMQAQQRLFPDAPLDVKRIRSMDADVSYRAAAVNAPALPLRGLEFRVRLDDGLLRGDPVAVTLPQGALRGRVVLNARGRTPVTELDLRLGNARLEQLVPVKSGGAQALRGPLAGRIQLKGEGASVHEAMSNADGQAVAVVAGGEVRQALAELLGVNVTKGLGLLLAEDQQSTPVRCAVADFRAVDGVLTARSIVFDTGPVLGVGEGRLDLGSERMAFRIKGHPKEARLIRLIAPITVEGPIRQPKVGVETGAAIAQGGIAAALGALVSPIAAILPFVDPGLAEDANCGALVAGAGRKGAPIASD